MQKLHNMGRPHHARIGPKPVVLSNILRNRKFSISLIAFGLYRAWVENFFGGVTTAHGINQVFKEYNGILRRIFWLGAFAGSFYLLFFFIIDAIITFIDAQTATAISTDSHNGLMPMVTLCNLSPIRCSCQAFYDPAILADDTLFQLVLPYVCSSVVSFKTTSWEPLDSQGNVITWNLLENAIDFVDIPATKANMAAFAPSAINCDSGAYTAAVIVAKIKAKALTYQDLYAYSGYSTRTKIVRNCMVVDSNQSSAQSGQKISCMDDTWWGPADYDPDYGACQTFNPCHGFPVGSACDSNSDCQHYADPTLTGGSCASGSCACNRCAAGTNCKLATQLNPGRGRGMRIIADVGSDQDPTLSAASNARWADGLLVHLHTQHDRGNLGAGVSVPPGSATDLALAVDAFSDTQYPFTNCSVNYNVDTDVCKATCLRRMQASACCGASVPAVVLGKSAPIVVNDPVVGAYNVSNPLLLCNILSPTVTSCFGDQAAQVSSGLACIEGSMGFTSPYYGGLWKRANWYDTQDQTTATQVGSQEAKSLRIVNQCVWTDDDNNIGEAKYGVSCNADSDCKSSTGGKQGSCMNAFRAYCPPKCDYYQYSVSSINSAALSFPTVQIIAADELAQATTYYQLVPTAQRRWKPKCAPGAAGNGTTCFTDAQAQAHVLQNYALVNIDFVTFDVTLTETVEGITIATLMGTIGGNLGMFVGMSVMTCLEWLELLFFACAAAPFFWCGIRAGPFVRNADPPEEEEEEGEPEELDDDVKQVLRNISAIAARKHADQNGGDHNGSYLITKPGAALKADLAIDASGKRGA